MSSRLMTTFVQAAPAEKEHGLRQKLVMLQQLVAAETERRRAAAAENGARLDLQSVADVAVFAKAAEWILRHNEFFKPNYVAQTERALDIGLKRVAELANDKPSWQVRPGKTVRGYYSKIDGSVQPYALTLPRGFDPEKPTRWPVYVVLHGRSGEMNEVNFISRHEDKPAPEEQTWIQIDVYGRGNNAYRWAGETDVFEAIEDVRRRFRVDDRRITLWGFSMGGAGAWHLGLHHPGRWAAVGAGAGFVDFYKYQKRTEKLPPWQDKTLTIYDSINYVLNAANVPFVTYGGDQDPQLLAGKSSTEAAEKFGVEIELLIGKDVGHKFDPESQRRFMAFLAEHTQAGRPGFPGSKSIRFVTYTPKYNRCDWLEVAQIGHLYEPATVEGGIDKDGTLRLKTKNVATLKIARDVATDIEIDGRLLPLSFAADGLLPDVYFVPGREGWRVLNYEDSRAFDDNPNRMKRHNLQGPIDDAFMEPFVCVRGSGAAWEPEQAAWSDWTFERFRREFDKWMRADVPTVKDTDLTEDMIAEKNLILFGDPGSNRVLAKVLPELPLRWTRESFQINGETYDPKTHGLSLIYPNPLNLRKYVIVNSGHTFHDKDFRASNAWLFPRLGDIAVQRFTKPKNGDEYTEEIVWATLFNSAWRLPEK